VRPALRPAGWPGAVGVVSAITSAALRVAVVPLFVTPIIDRVIGAGDLAALPGVLLTAGAAVVGMALTLAVQDAALAHGGAVRVAQLRERAYRALLARTPGRLPGTSGGLAGRVVSDVREVETFHQYGMGTLLAESVAVLGIVAVLAWRAPLATLLLLALGVPAVWLLERLGARLRASADRAQAGTEAVAADLQEGLKHHAVVRAFDAEGFMLDRFQAANVATRRAASRRSVLAALQVPVTQLAVFAALAGLVALLAGRAAAGVMSVGQVVEYLTLVALLSTPAQLLPRGYALLRQAEAALDRMDDLLTPTAHASTVEPPVVEGALEGGESGLTLQGVWARHGEGDWVLRGASAHAPARGLVVVTGESGVGKSTLLSVLLGFLAAERGSVHLDGVPLDRSRVAWVPQSLDLLRGSLRDTLTLGRSIPDERVWEAVQDVGMADAVRRLPGHLDATLDEDGAGLSGGQRQRLLVARALLRDPAVLLLDEPTANLDAEAEAALVETLMREAERRLVIAVAHREALPRAAHRVWHVVEGEIVEMTP